MISARLRENTPREEDMIFEKMEYMTILQTICIGRNIVEALKNMELDKNLITEKLHEVIALELIQELSAGEVGWTNEATKVYKVTLKVIE